jgi:ribosomal protein L18E
MPMGPHRTHTVPVNLRDLERVFDDGAEATLEAMVEKGLIKNTRTDVKVLGQGELTKKLAVTAHSFSATAREKIEQAGGSVTALRPPREEKKRRRKAAPAPGAADEPEEATAEAEPADEAEPEAEETAEESAE